MRDSTTLERVSAITRIPALADLHPDDLASLAGRAEERRIGPGETYSSEDGDRAVCLLLSGGLEVGAERRTVAAPALVGAVEALAGVGLPTRAGDEGAHVATLDRHALGWVMADVYEVWVAMLRHTASRWLAAERLVAEPPRIHPPPRLDAPSSLVTRILLLSGADLLGSLRPCTVGRLASEIEELRLPAAAVLWEAGSTSDDIFVVVEGAFVRSSGSGSASGSETLPADPGAVLGLREALAKALRASRVATTADARVLRLSCETLIDELEDDPDAAEALLALLARRVLDAEATRRSERR